MLLRCSEEGSSYGTSILGNIKSGEFQLPRGISNIFSKQGGGQQAMRGSLSRKKEKTEVRENNKPSLFKNCFFLFVVFDIKIL